jgi:hypothetical protein
MRRFAASFKLIQEFFPKLGWFWESPTLRRENGLQALEGLHNCKEEFV